MTPNSFWACCLSILVFGFTVQMQATPEDSSRTDDRAMIKAIFDESLINGQAYPLLEHLCLDIGHRLSGSPGAAQAIAWTKQKMEEYGFDRVFLQEVTVPHWVRGEKEVARLVGSPSNGASELSALALGGSISTPESGLTAEVIEVKSLDEVTRLGSEKISGKIVFYNRAFDQRNLTTGPGYGGAVDQRSQGAIRAAEQGAVGVVIRSVTSAFDDEPHTGMMHYSDEVPRIPAAALGMQSADRLTETLKRDGTAKLFLHMNCRWLPDTLSHNVVGEIRGKERPEEIIVVGGHLDSWDVGQGAHDDGAGCMQAIDALRTLKAIGYQPRCTLRAVMFINEENGVRGGEKYAELAAQNGERHIAAIESDAGGFSPRAFGVTGSAKVVDTMRSWLPLFDQNTISFIRNGGGGVDISPLNRKFGVPAIGLVVDSQRYFDVHHSHRDTFDAVNRRELQLGTASLAALIYLIDKYGWGE